MQIIRSTRWNVSKPMPESLPVMTKFRLTSRAQPKHRQPSLAGLNFVFLRLATLQVGILDSSVEID